MRIKHFAVSVLPVAAVLFLFCGNYPSSLESKNGSLVIRAQILQSNLAKASESMLTTYDSVVVVVSASDIGTMRRSKKITLGEFLFTDTFPGIPSGSNRKITVTTVDKSGFTVHVDSVGSRTVRIYPGSVSDVNAVLVPAVGSIYLQIAGIPTSVDSIFASFVSNDTSWVVHVARNTRVFISIDKIPNKTKGTLYVSGVGSGGDTIYTASRDLTFNALSNSSVTLEFKGLPGNLSLNLSIYDPGITLVSGSMDGLNIADSESGILFITELMYKVDKAEYVEIYNPGTDSLFLDTLLVVLDKTINTITDVEIEGKGFYVFGRGDGSWIDQSNSFLNLSASGNWIALLSKDSTVIDQVIFTGESNKIEWPVVKDSRSIELVNKSYDALSNNFGRNWRECPVFYDSAGWYGTPGF